MSVKSIDRTVKRIQEKYGISDSDAEIMEHMLWSCVESRDRRLRYLVKKAEQADGIWQPTKKRIIGGIRCAINAHGPITIENMESAAKRILYACQLDKPE